jgi:hypothetical protein
MNRRFGSTAYIQTFLMMGVPPCNRPERFAPCSPKCPRPLKSVGTIQLTFS